MDDVTDFVKPTVTFNLREAAKDVIAQYSFLNQFDSHDRDFLMLAGILLGEKSGPKESISRLQKIDNPLKFLFTGINISNEASEISIDEIKPFHKTKNNLRVCKLTISTGLKIRARTLRLLLKLAELT